MRHQGVIDVNFVQQALHGVRRIESAANRLDFTGALEFANGPHAALQQRCSMGLESGSVKVMVEVVDRQSVDIGNAQPLQRLFVRAHHAVVAVIEDRFETQSACPGRPVERARVPGASQRSTDFGDEHIFAPVLRTQKGSEPEFRKSPAVPGGGIVESHPGTPSGFQRR